MAAAAAATTSMSAPESEPGSASANKPPPEKRHKELQKRLDKMDKRGFLKPSQLASQTINIIVSEEGQQVA